MESAGLSMTESNDFIQTSLIELDMAHLNVYGVQIQIL